MIWDYSYFDDHIYTQYSETSYFSDILQKGTEGGKILHKKSINPPFHYYSQQDIEL